MVLTIYFIKALGPHGVFVLINTLLKYLKCTLSMSRMGVGVIHALCVLHHVGKLKKFT